METMALTVHIEESTVRIACTTVSHAGGVSASTSSAFTKAVNVPRPSDALGSSRRSIASNSASPRATF